MIPVILQVHVDRGQWVDVPITPDTCCHDVIECCREPGDQPCRLVQTMGFTEEAVPLDAFMVDVLNRWGKCWPSVAFHLQYSDVQHHLRKSGPRPLSPTEFVTNPEWKSRKLPENGELSLSELRQMAARQQHQIEAHQQLLVAKEQRLKFLKQQEARHQQHQQNTSVDADRLRQLREKVELQELKLRRLRALRGQVEQHRSNNTNLSAELESIRALFNEKEKELSLAVAKVEELTRQLEDVRRGDMRQGTTPSPAAIEFQKLRKELMYRSKLNEQQNARIAHQRETLAKRQSEISQMDQRIAELQQRLQRKRLLNQQLSSQLHAASRARPRANIAAVEPLKRMAQDIEVVQDDLKVSGDPVPDFTPNKKDPKYQTLPYNTKFTGVVSHEGPTVVNGEVDKHGLVQNGAPPPYPEPPNRYHSPPHKPSPPQGMGNLSPRPFGSTLLNPSENGNKGRMQQLKTTVPVSATTNTASTVQQPPQQKPVTGIAGIHRSKLPVSYQGVLPPTVMTRTVPQTPARLHPSTGPKLTTNDVSKPAVPPKPGGAGTPGKPVPPPRQTHGVGSLLNNLPKPNTVDQALSVLKGGNRVPETRSSSRLLSPAVHHRLPTFNHQQKHHLLSKQDSHSDSSKDTESDSGSPQSKGTSNKIVNVHHPSLSSESNGVHISFNRRIGIPPAFFFPENQTPPSDLNVCDPLDDRLPPKRRTELVDKIDHGSILSPSSEVQLSKPDSPKENAESSSPLVPLPDSPSEATGSPPSVDVTDRAAVCDDDDLGKVDRPAIMRRVKKGNLKTKNRETKSSRRVSFDPLALLLDAALEGELELVKKTAKEVTNPSAANDEGITALHNAICAGHFDIVKFLVEFGCDVNSQDSDGWTPLHCAASCNNLSMVKYLVERGACIFATTLSDHETAAEKCEEEAEGFDGCSEYLYSMQEKLGILNGGKVYALYDYESQNADELGFHDGDQLIVLRKGDDMERDWWWSKNNDREGYIPRNLLGLYPRVTFIKKDQ